MLLVVAAAAAALPSPVLGHQLVGRLESPLPLAVYLAGAAMAVALSFAFVLLRDVRAPEPREPRYVRAPRWLVGGIRALGLIAWIWIVVQTIIGGSSTASVAPLFLWVYGWVGRRDAVGLRRAGLAMARSVLDPLRHRRRRDAAPRDRGLGAGGRTRSAWEPGRPPPDWSSSSVSSSSTAATPSGSC